MKIKQGLLTLAISSFSCFDKADIIPLNVPFFSQRCGIECDRRMIYEPNGYNITNSGCMVTSFAMALAYYGVNTDNLQFHDWLKLNGGYRNGEFIRTLTEDYASMQNITTILGNLVEGTNNQAIREELAKGYPVIVKNEYGPYQTHWLVIVEERNGHFYALDPLSTTQELVQIDSTKQVGATHKYANYPYIKYITIRGPLDQQQPITFNFPYQNSLNLEGWSTGYDTHYTSGSTYDGTWLVNVVGPNPGVVSPNFDAGQIKANKTMISFSVKVSGTVSLYDKMLGKGVSTKNVELWIMDKNSDGTDDWNHKVDLGLKAIVDGKYHEYAVDLSKFSALANIDIRRFSIELTEDTKASNESWLFDWIKLEPIGSGSYGFMAVNSIMLTSVHENTIELIPIPTEPVVDPDPPPEVIVPPPTAEICLPPQNFRVLSSDNIITLHWDNINSELRDYSIELWENNGPMITREVPLLSPFSYTENNLTLGKEYYFKVKTYCSNILSSSYSNAIYFTFRDERKVLSPPMQPGNFSGRIIP